MQKQKSIIREYLEVVLLSIAVAILLRLFVVSAYRVESGSMTGALLEGDALFVNKLAYFSSGPERGDIIVFHYPNDVSKDYIKRVIGLPNDTITIVNKAVFVNGQKIPEPLLAQHVDSETLSAQQSFRDNYGPTVVPPNEYFVMGDDRDNSNDSRFWGFVPAKNIVGKCLFIYWSWNPAMPCYIPTGFRPSRVFASTR